MIIEGFNIPKVIHLTRAYIKNVEIRSVIERTTVLLS